MLMTKYVYFYNFNNVLQNILFIFFRKLNEKKYSGNGIGIGIDFFPFGIGIGIGIGIGFWEEMESESESKMKKSGISGTLI